MYTGQRGDDRKRVLTKPTETRALESAFELSEVRIGDWKRTGVVEARRIVPVCWWLGVFGRD